jgi:hypothetical protein
MQLVTRTIVAFPGLCLGIASVLAAQDSDTPACKALPIPEVRRITGTDYPNHSDGEANGTGGGSSCQYGGPSMMPGKSTPMLSFVLIPGKNYTETRRKAPTRPGCTWEPAPGVGDAAYFESCPNSKIRRSSPLYVKAGTNDFILQLDIEPPATEASARPTLIALGKAVATKLR